MRWQKHLLLGSLAGCLLAACSGTTIFAVTRRDGYSRNELDIRVELYWVRCGASISSGAKPCLFSPEEHVFFTPLPFMDGIT